jgi:hypothetical protein
VCLCSLFGEQIIKNIERGEQKIQRQADILDAIAGKLARYKNPWNELKVCGAQISCVCSRCIPLPAQTWIPDNP